MALRRTRRYAVGSPPPRRAHPQPTADDRPVFNIPEELVRIFDRNLTAAGIPKRDERGRTLDVHALRTMFGTRLSKFGVLLRTAQAAMRHSDPSLTANVYTDPRLLDVSGPLHALPSLPLGGVRIAPGESEPERPGPTLRALAPLHQTSATDDTRGTAMAKRKPSLQ